MVEKIVIAIDQPFEVRPVEGEIGTGIMVPTFFGKQEITKKIIYHIPDYEQTNIKFAHKIMETILSKAKELGEITRIELSPTSDTDEDGKRYYRMFVEGNLLRTKVEENIEVPEHYGEIIEE